MHAEKVILETNQDGQIISLPKLPPNAQLEAIFLVLNQNSKKKEESHQQKLQEKGKLWVILSVQLLKKMIGKHRIDTVRYTYLDTMDS